MRSVSFGMAAAVEKRFPGTWPSVATFDNTFRESLQHIDAAREEVRGDKARLYMPDGAVLEFQHDRGGWKRKSFRIDPAVKLVVSPEKLPALQAAAQRAQREFDSELQTGHYVSAADASKAMSAVMESLFEDVVVGPVPGTGR